MTYQITIKQTGRIIATETTRAANALAAMNAVEAMLRQRYGQRALWTFEARRVTG